MADNFDYGKAIDSWSDEEPKEPEAPKDKYGEAIDKWDNDAASVNLKSTETVDPDRFARALDLSEKSGLPARVVEGNEDYVERKLSGAAARKALRDARKTAAFLSNPDNAKLAHDDVEALAEVEKRIRGVNSRGRGTSVDLPTPVDMGRGAAGGVVGDFAGRTIEGFGDLNDVAARTVFRPIILGLEAAGLDDAAQFLRNDLQKKNVFQEPGGILRDLGEDIKPEERNFATDVAGAVGQLAGQITVAILTGGVSTLPSLAMMVGQGASIQADMVEESGETGTVEGDIATIAGAGITALTERFGLDMLLNKLPAQAKGRIFQILASGGSEGAQEIVENVLQNLTAFALYNPDVDILDGALYEGGVGATAGAIAGMIIPGRQAIRTRDALDKAHEAALASKTNDRVPAKGAEHAGAVFRDDGVDNVSINANAVEQYFQSNPDVDPAKFLGDIGVPDDAYQEALLRDGDIDLTPEAYAQHIQGTDRYESFRDHVRLTAEADTAAEAEAALNGGLRDQFERMAADGTLDEDTLSDVDTIRTEIESQLTAAGQDISTAQYEATLLAQRYAVRGQRAGQSPLEMWRRDAVRIQGPQGGAAPVDDLTILLDKARSTDPERFLGLSRTPVIDDLIARGGVDPDSELGQALKAMDAKRPGLFKRGGLTAADNIPAVDTGGMFEPGDASGYVSQDDIIAAVRDELAGSPRRSPDQQAELEMFTGDVENLMSILEDAGLTLDSPDADIRAAIQARTFEQEALSETKVVGENGRPLLVYHGTNTSFDQFADGATFFSDQETAQDYADEFEGVKGEDGPRVVASYLDIRNPASDADVLRVAGVPEAEWETNFAPEFMGDDVVAALKAEGFDGIIFEADASPSRPGEMVRSYAVFSADQIVQPGGDITQTPAFKAWFGDSKVVDANGEPLVVYHGSNEEIGEFSARRAQDKQGRAAALGYGRGKFYFSDEQKVARSYSLMRGADKPVVQSVYLSAQNPIDAKEYESRFKEKSGGREIFNGYDAEYTMFDRDALIAELDAEIQEEGYDAIWQRDLGQVAVFSPTQIKSVHNRGTFDANDPRILYQPAFHGSPHIFDRFSLDAIGAGEGAQAYGWGLYFAGKKQVAEFYRDALTDPDSIPLQFKGRPVDTVWNNEIAERWSDVTESMTESQVEDFTTVLGNLSQVNRLQDVGNVLSGFSPEQKKMYRELVVPELVEPEISDGRLYKVEIPDDSEYLDWDKPLSEQSEKVQEALAKLADSDPTYDISNSSLGEEMYNSISVALRDQAYADGAALTREMNLSGEGWTDENLRRHEEIKYRYENADRAASEALAAAGIPGIRYLDGSSRQDGDGTHNHVIFDENLIEIVEYEQRQGGAGNRGSIQFGRETVITLGANADRSTFLHESGHLFLEQLAQDAREFGTEQLVNDWNTVREWWGENAASIKREAIDYAKRANDTEAVESLTAMSEADVARGARMGDLSDPYLGRAMHEQWARGTEDYFRTGQAPSVALQDAFNRFRAWLVSIYSALKRRMGAEQLDVVFSPEVKEVMDRLLATDEEIELVKQQYDMRAMFGSAEEIGMTPKQFEAYQRMVARASEDAKTSHLKRHLREIEREQKEQWKSEADRVREEVSGNIADRPVYRALYALARNETATGDPAPIDHGRLDKKGVVAALENTESLARLPKVRGMAVYTTKKNESGTHPDVIAQMYGYEDGRAMLMDMMNAPTFEAAVEAEVDAIMKERHGDMLNDGSAVEKAIEATHNDKRGEVLAIELNALRDSKDKMKPAFIRAWAKERIGTRKVDQIQPQKFLAIERKKGIEAGRLLRAGDRLGAQRAKFQQLLNFHMAQEAYKVRNEVAKNRKYMAGFTKGKATFKSIEADYVDQIRGILENYNLAPRLSDAKRKRLEKWAEEQREDGAILEIPPEILAADGKKHFRDLTLDEFRTLVDTIKNIEAQGRNAKRSIIEGEEIAINEMADDIVSRLEDRPQNKRVARMAKEQNPGDVDKFVGKLASFDASLRKVEFLLQDIDGESNGPAHRYIFQTFADAEAAKNDITKSVTRLIMDGMHDLKNLGEKFRIGQQGRSYRRSDLIMMALNVGNESNYQKMIEGSAKDVVDGAVPLTEEIVDEALSNLTEADWNFVQSVWDAIESMYPQVEEIYRRENGVSPQKIEAREFTTKYGQELRGGYFPMMYDPERSTQARDIEGKTALEAMQSTAVKASVYSGMTKARTGFSAPVLLDLEKLPMHIEKTAHYITHYEAVRLTRKLISRRDVVSAIVNKLGREKYDVIKDWVGELASNGQPVPHNDTAGRIVEAMRSNATIAIMGFSYTTMMAQTLGYSQTIDILSKTEDGGYNPAAGAKWTAIGIAEYMKNPREAKRKVFELSGEMRHRLQNTDRDIRHSLGRLTSKKKNAWRNFQRFSLMGIAGVQMYTVDFPTWLGAYSREISRGATQGEAARAADSVLRMSQTAGGLKDLAAIQRQPGVNKALTMFYSFFSLLYNVQADALGKTKRARDVPQLAARAFVLLAMPAYAEAFMRNEWPDEDDDESLVAFLALKPVFYALGAIPFLRDMLGMAEGFGYSLSPVDSLGESLGRAVRGIARDIDDGEADASTIKAILSTIGFAKGVPVTQVNRIIDAADAMHEGEDVGPYDFLIGHKDK